MQNKVSLHTGIAEFRTYNECLNNHECDGDYVVLFGRVNLGDGLVIWMQCVWVYDLSNKLQLIENGIVVMVHQSICDQFNCYK